MLCADAGRQLLIDLGVEPELYPLTSYLIMTHHGHIHITARNPCHDGVGGLSLFGRVDKEPIDTVIPPGTELPESVVDLGISRSRPDSWTTSTLTPLKRLGSFHLAYLRTSVHMADWRISINPKLPVTEGTEE